MFAAILPALPLSASAQQRISVPQSRILQTVDDTRLTTLAGNTHPLARSEFDQGALASDTTLHRMVLVLQRSAEQETALQRLLDQQQDKGSSSYHQWLTPQSFGESFGPSQPDLTIVTAWLGAHGFTGIQVNAGRTMIEFSGAAARVTDAFHTTIHRYNVEGSQHYANASDPQIPTALAPVISGLLSLNNFPRKAASHRAGTFRRDTAAGTVTRIAEGRASTTELKPNFTYSDQGYNYYALTPYDFATIYNVLPLWNAATPIDGTGQTIAIVGETDINPADFVNFRKLFNLPLGNTATPTGTQYLNIIYNGPNPGVLSDEGEADIDTQWSSAIAKGATIDYVVSASTEVSQGTDLSAAYIVDNNLAPVMSYSYGQCELFLGTSGNAFYSTLWQQAAAQGITVLVSSGDSGSAGCDSGDPNYAVDGLAVNGLGSTPYNVSVGGTDFYMPNGGTAYWSSTNSATTEASAKGYIPETTWNDSCTNAAFSLTQRFLNQTPEQVCNASRQLGLLTVAGGGGGASSCIQSNGSSTGSCTSGYAKPSWQSGTGVPADGVRDIPDVSLFSSDAFYGAFYLVCQQSLNVDGRACSLAAPAYDFVGYGGTSVASPAFAGIVSLVNQKTGSRQGNANYVLYNLARQQTTTGTACNAASGTTSASCMFNDITTNTITMPCLRGSRNCTVTNSADSYGVLSGWSSTTGYDLATGLGSVNAANLINDWSSASYTSSSATLTLSPASITHGSPVSASVQVTSTSGTPTGNVTIDASAVNGAAGFGTLTSGSFITSISSFPGGSYTVRAHYAGDGTFAASDSNTVGLTVTPEPSATTLRPLLYNIANGQTAVVSTQTYGSLLLIRTDVKGLSGQGIATGNVTLSDNGSPLDNGSYHLNSSGYTEDQTTVLAPGSHVLQAVYSGDPSFNPSQSGSAALTITKAGTTLTAAPKTTVVSNTSSFPFTAQIKPLGDGLGAYPTGTVSVSSGNVVLGTSTLGLSDEGSVSLTLLASQLGAGLNTLTATYSGDANYLASGPVASSITVNASSLAASTVTLQLSGATVAPGAGLTATAVVLPASPIPTGSVAFAVDGKQLASANTAAGQATVAIANTGLSSGTHTLTAIYSGDFNYGASGSAPVRFTIAGASVASATSISLSTSTAVQGTTVSVTSNITPALPFPTGSAQLVLDGNTYGLPVQITGGAATLQLTTATLQPGSHTVAVSYSGDGMYLASISVSTALTISAPAGSFNLTPSMLAATVVRGGASQPLTLSATPVGGFNAPVRFACTAGLPSGAICTFAPASVTPQGSAASTALTITTASLTARDAAAHPSVPRSRAISSLGGGAAIASLLFLFVPRRRRDALTLVFILVFGTLTALTGCGSGTTVTSGGGASGNTPAGTYAVTVTASSISVTQTATINLTVQ